MKLLIATVAIASYLASAPMEELRLRAELKELRGCAAKIGDERNSITNELAQLVQLRRAKRSKD